MGDEHQHMDEFFMQRAMDLALMGCGSVSPNPMVGCVIVHQNKIIGEGWHKKYGGPHAEVNAVECVTQKELLKESTVYVTLEPCSHFGKTPPCADMLVNHSVKKVVIATPDTNPLVAGKGIEKLKNAGIEVVSGTLLKRARELNRRFFTSMEKRRPYVILKWAETADGFIARKNFDSKWISNALSRKIVHRWRAEEDAVLVGTATALHDNPRLNVRDRPGRDPVRVVIDRSLKLRSDLALFDQTQPTICYNVVRDEDRENLTMVKLPSRDFLAHLVGDLHKRKIHSLIVEGGTQTLQAFVDAELWDEARIFISGNVFKEGIKAPVIEGFNYAEEKIENDFLKVLRRSSSG